MVVVGWGVVEAWDPAQVGRDTPQLLVVFQGHPVGHSYHLIVVLTPNVVLRSYGFHSRHGPKMKEKIINGRLFTET